MAPDPVDIAADVRELVGESLGRDREEIEIALSGYLSDLRRSLRNGGLAEIPGFGVFKLNDGRIEFETDTRLADAINFRYAGLEALSIRPYSPSEPEPSEVSPTAAASDSVEKAEAESEPLASDASGPVDWLPIGEQVIPSQKKPNSVEPRPDRSPDSGDRRERKSQRLSPTSSTAENGKPGNRRTILMIIVPLVVIGAAIGGFAIYNSITGQDANPTISSSESLLPDNPSAGLEVDPAPTPGASSVQPSPGDGSEGTAEDDGNDVVSADTPVVSPPPVSEETAPNTARRTQGESAFVSDFDRSATGYTLMVGSVDNESDAQRGISRYSGLDLPRAILTDEENGIIRYRLAVGRFDTIESAQEEIARLGNRIPSDTWVYRIRLNTAPPGQQN